MKPKSTAAVDGASPGTGLDTQMTYRRTTAPRPVAAAFSLTVLAATVAGDARGFRQLEQVYSDASRDHHSIN